MKTNEKEKYTEKAARIIILKKRKILLIHRFKENKEYFVLPGGSVENNETPEQAVIREVKEETNLDINLGECLWEFEENIEGKLRYGYYFLAKSFKGEPTLGGPEVERQTETNKYIFEWIPLEKIDALLIYPFGLKERILEKFRKN